MLNGNLSVENKNIAQSCASSIIEYTEIRFRFGCRSGEGDWRGVRAGLSETEENDRKLKIDYMRNSIRYYTTAAIYLLCVRVHTIGVSLASCYQSSHSNCSYRTNPTHIHTTSTKESHPFEIIISSNGDVDSWAELAAEPSDRGNFPLRLGRMQYIQLPIVSI